VPMAERVLLGRVARLQVQRERLKGGGRYDPGPLLEVGRAVIGPAGLLGWHDGGWLVDVHGSTHPASRGGGRRAVSVGFEGHYRIMAEHFGAVAPGIAGENVILDTGRRVLPAEVAGGVVVESTDGDLHLDGVRVAAPCREFTSFLLGLPEAVAREQIAAEMAALDGGIRGYVASVDHLATWFTVVPGDRVYTLGDGG
jgi:hypothetical protein